MKRGVFFFLTTCLLIIPLRHSHALVSTLDAGGFGKQVTYEKVIQDLGQIHKSIVDEFSSSYEKQSEFRQSVSLLNAKVNPAQTVHILDVEAHISKLRTLQTNLRIQYLLTQSINRRLQESGSKKLIQIGELDQKTLEGIHSLVHKARQDPKDLEGLIQSNLVELAKTNTGNSGQDSDFLNALHSSLNDSETRKAVTAELESMNDPFWGDEFTRAEDARVLGGNLNSPAQDTNVAINELGQNPNEITEPLSSAGAFSGALENPQINAPMPDPSDQQTTSRAPASTDDGGDSSARHQNGMRTMGTSSSSDTSRSPQRNTRTTGTSNLNMSEASTGATNNPTSSGTSSNPVKTSSTSGTTSPTQALQNLKPPSAKINCVNGNCTEKIITLDEVYKYEESLRQIRKQALEEADAELAKAGIKREGYKVDEAALSHLSDKQRERIQTNLAAAEDAEKREMQSRETKDIQDANESCDLVLRTILQINVKSLGKDTHACIQTFKNEIDRLNRLPVKPLNGEFNSFKKVKNIRDAINRCARDTAGKPELRRLAVRNAYRELGVKAFNQTQSPDWKNHSVAIPTAKCNDLVLAAEKGATELSKGESDLIAFDIFRKRVDSLLPPGKKEQFTKAKTWEEVFSRRYGRCDIDAASQFKAYERETVPTEMLLGEIARDIDSLKQGGGIGQEELARRSKILSACAKEQNWFTRILAQYPKDKSLSKEQGLELIQLIYTNYSNNNLIGNTCLANGVLYQYLQDLQTLYVMQIRNAQGLVVHECFSTRDSDAVTPPSAGAVETHIKAD